jgi:RNA polymerase subunit RPABC4/transcription elongation factor Spt4
MKCPNCHHEILEGSKYCQYCGAEIADNEQTIETESTVVDIEDKKAAQNAVLFGSLSVFASIFFEGFVYYIAIVFGFFAFVYGFRIRTKLLNKAILAMTLGFLGIFLSVLFLIKTQKVINIVNQIDDKCQEKFAIALPTSPDQYLINDNLLPSYPFKANKYHYVLSQEDIESILAARDDWEQLPLPEYFTDYFEEAIFNFNQGKYLIYDNLSSSLSMPDSLNDYDLIVIIIDTENSEISIYEFWK